MEIERTSPLTGITRNIHIDITPEQYARWQGGEFIQSVAPHLSVDDREYLISGVYGDEWALMGCEDE